MCLATTVSAPVFGSLVVSKVQSGPRRPHSLALSLSLHMILQPVERHPVMALACALRLSLAVRQSQLCMYVRSSGELHCGISGSLKSTQVMSDAD